MPATAATASADAPRADAQRARTIATRGSPGSSAARRSAAFSWALTMPDLQ